MNESAVTIEKKSSYQGPSHKITFKEGAEPCAVYFENEQKAECYFEV